MNTYKRNATAAGILLLIGTAAGFAVLPFLGVVQAQAYLTEMAEIPRQIMMGGLLIFIMGAACASISIALYPVLRKVSHSMALGSVAFRLAEGILQITKVVLLAALLALSQEYTAAGAGASAIYESLGGVFKTAYTFAGSVAALLAWCIGAFLYYLLFYRSRLIPRWLSLWGLIGILLSTAAILLPAFQIIGPENPLAILLHLPIIPQELVLGVWLIIKGFEKPALASLEAARA